MAEAIAGIDRVSEGQAALAAGSWERARTAFAAAIAQGESAEAVDGLGWAAWWLDDAQTCIEARERAYRLYRDGGDLQGAARMALWLSDDHMEFRGDEAVASGWFHRAARILDELDTCPEHAWLVALEAYAAMGTAEAAEARRLCERARALGRSHGLAELELFALAMEGVVLVDGGSVTEGLRCLDEAAAGVLSGDCQDLASVAFTCCLVVGTCDRVRDVDRAVQWWRQVEEFCGRHDLRFVHGACRAHHASALVWHGDWQAAETELVAAVSELDGPRSWWWKEAVVCLAELRRRQGRTDEAEELFGRAEGHPRARLGVATLLLERGEVDTARALAERALRATLPDRPTLRAEPLGLLVRATAGAGDNAAARAYRDELREIADAAGIASLHAAAASAEGTVAAADGDHETARQAFGDAADAFARTGAPYELCDARLWLAESLAALGRTEAAVHEATAALDGFGGLGALAQQARARRLLGQLDAERGHQQKEERALTPRQLDVLRLVAAGSTDRQIATQLVLSEHTVHRHIANILNRLGSPSRAAAVAEASRRGLL